MKRKILLLLLIAVSSVCLTVGFAACGENNTHTHVFDKRIESEAYVKEYASCDAKQTYYYSCECGARGSETFTIGDFVHSYGKHETDAATVKIASCKNGTVYYYSCDGCGALDTEHTFEADDKEPHNEVPVEGKAATCLETGLTDGVKCSVCKTMLVEQKVIPISGHNYYAGKCKTCQEPASVSEGLSYILSDDETCYIVSGIGTCTDKDVVIPSTYNELPVTAIADGAFANLTTVNSIALPYEYSQTIGAEAFMNSSITYMVIPSNLVSIGAGAFSGCHSLEEVDMTSYHGQLPEKTFRYCFALKKIVIPESVTRIEDNTFENCGLEEVVFPESLESIGYYAFAGCTRLEELNLPIGVREIDDRAFYNCNFIKSINLPEDSLYYTSIDGNLYDVKRVTLNDETGKFEITEADFVLYAKGKEDTSFTVPAFVGKINIEAFAGCYNLVEVTVSEGVKEICSSAFENCSELTKVTLPDSVVRIGDLAFRYCWKLKEFTVGNGIYSAESFLDLNGLEYNAEYSVCSEYENGLYLGNATNPYAVLMSVKDKSVTSFKVHADTRVIAERALSFENQATVILSDNIVGFEYIYDNEKVKFNEYENGLYLGSANNPYLVLVEAKDGIKEIHPKTKVIADYAFDRVRTEFEGGRLILPDDVIYLGRSSLSNYIQEIVIPSTLKFIGETAFPRSMSVYYEGTMIEWQNIFKTQDFSDWHEWNAEITIYCINGTLDEKDMVVSFDTERP